MCITLYLFVWFADLGLSAAAIAGIVIAFVVPLCCAGILITIVVIAWCTGACAAGAVSSRARGRRRNVNAAATTVPATTAPPPYPGTDYPTQPQGANPDEQKVELQEYQADPAYPPPRNDQSTSYPAANYIVFAST